MMNQEEEKELQELKKLREWHRQQKDLLTRKIICLRRKETAKTRYSFYHPRPVTTTIA